MVQHGLPWHYFLKFQCENVAKIKNDQLCMWPKFIKDFIFKKNFLTKFQKLASLRSFDIGWVIFREGKCLEINFVYSLGYYCRLR